MIKNYDIENIKYIQLHKSLVMTNDSLRFRLGRIINYSATVSRHLLSTPVNSVYYLFNIHNFTVV